MNQPYDPNIRDSNFEQLNGDSKHDTVVIGRRVLEREKQRLEARCCPICGMPIEYTLTRGQFNIILPCSHEFTHNLHIDKIIYQERCPDGIQQS